MKGPARRNSGKLSSNQPVFRFSRKGRRKTAFSNEAGAVGLEFGGGGLYGRAGVLKDLRQAKKPKRLKEQTGLR
jgi:hypothetical protein